MIPDAIRLARATLATIRRNLAWAFGYNIAAIPLAAAGFLNPLIAGAAMAASSAFVVASSIRLRRFGVPRPPGRGRPGRHPARLRPSASRKWRRCHARDELRNQRQRPGRGRGVQGRAGAPGADRAAHLRAGRAGLGHRPDLDAGGGRGSGRRRPARPWPSPAWRRLLRIGFGVLWIFDGILQAQPKMAVGLPSQVIEPIAASLAGLGAAPGQRRRHHLVVSSDAGRRLGGVDPGRDRPVDAASRRAARCPGWPGWPASAGAWWSGCSARPSAASSPPA